MWLFKCTNHKRVIFFIVANSTMWNILLSEGYEAEGSLVACVQYNGFRLSTLSKCIERKTERTVLDCNLTPHVLDLVLILLMWTEIMRLLVNIGICLHRRSKCIVYLRWVKEFVVEFRFSCAHAQRFCVAPFSKCEWRYVWRKIHDFRKI
jgi:hypothetical protein